MLSGSVYGNIVNGHYQIRIDWSATQSIGSNESYVTYNAYFINDWDINIGERNLDIYIVNNYVSGSGQTFSLYVPPMRTKGEHYIGSCSKTITHQAEGHGWFTMSARYDIKVNINGTYYSNIQTPNQDFWLDQIPRLSNISIDRNDVFMGETINISIKRYSNDFTNNIYYAFCGRVAVINDNNAVNIPFVVPIDFANEVTNATSNWGRIICETYYRGTYIGENSVVFTAHVPNQIVPSFDELHTRMINNNIPSDWNSYIQNKSQCEVTFPNATSQYGATIVRYEVSSNTGLLTYLPNCWFNLNHSGNIVFTGTITDSRGRTATKTTTINVVPYNPPQIISVLSQRCLVDGSLNDEGTYVKCECDFNFSSCGGKNISISQIAYRKFGTQVWKLTSATFSDSEPVIVGNDEINIDASYEIKYIVRDTFDYKEKIDSVSTAFTTMDFKKGGRGVSVGKVSEHDNIFEIAPEWDLMSKGEIVSDFIIAEGIDSLTGWNYIKYNSGWVDLWKDIRFVVSFDDANTQNGNEKLPSWVLSSYNPIVLPQLKTWGFVNWMRGFYVNNVGTDLVHSVVWMLFGTNRNGNGETWYAGIYVKGRWK